MRSLQDELLSSPAFRTWLTIISRLLPLRYAVEARRFRPGLDYTLATSEDKEARLDVILELAPPVRGREKSTDSDSVEESQLAQMGGWDVGVFLYIRTLRIYTLRLSIFWRAFTYPSKPHFQYSRTMQSVMKGINLDLRKHT